MEVISTLPQELIVILSQMDASSPDLAACGPSSFHLIRSIFALFAQSTTTALVKAKHLSSALLRLSNEKILSYDYKDVPVCWRRMYTDSTLLFILACLAAQSSSSSKEEELLDCIKSLDLILIIAGAPGPDRERYTFTLIHYLQNQLASSPSSPPSKRPRLHSPPTSKGTRKDAPYLHSPILRLEKPPTSILHFHTLLKEQGVFILSKGCSDWPASEAHKWGTTRDYLRTIAGRGRVVPVEVGSSYTSSDWTQKIVLFDEFLDSLEARKADGKEGIMYLAQHDLFRQLPSLLSDIEIPDWVYCAPPPSSSLPHEIGGVEYKPPTTEEGYILNAWLGPEGTFSPAHTDPFYNCFAQVVGTKWIWVAPPSTSPWMTTFGSSIHTSHEEERESISTLNSYMTNTSRIDVTLPPPLEPTASSSSSEQWDYITHVVPFARQAVLQEGDLLFMSPGWWHALKSLETSFGVSIWF